MIKKKEPKSLTRTKKWICIWAHLQTW